jgi:predicted DNA-binding transcriptional regulator YafY
MVAGRADPVLAKAAQDLIAKIVDTIPERLQPLALEPASRARPKWVAEADTTDMTQLRAHIYASRKVRLHYRDEQGRDTERTVWPIAIGYLETVLHLASWCELRKTFAASASTGSRKPCSWMKSIPSGARPCG